MSQTAEKRPFIIVGDMPIMTNSINDTTEKLKDEINALQEKVDNLHVWVTALTSVILIILPVVTIMAGLALWKLR